MYGSVRGAEGNLRPYRDPCLHSRLVRRVQAGETLRDRRGPPAKAFARRYTPEDVRLLAEVDALHGNLSGPATRKLCERAWEVFGDARYKRLAGISNGHLYIGCGPSAGRHRAGLDPTPRRCHPEAGPNRCTLTRQHLQTS